MRALLESNGLSRISDAVVSLTIPSIRLTLTRCGYDDLNLDAVIDQSPVGISKIGGNPDLPPNFDWPLWEEMPLSFVAQFNVADIAPLDVEKALPKSGILYFFYDVTMEAFVSGGDPVNWKVVYYDGDVSALSRTPAPTGLPEFGELAPNIAIFSEELSIPNWECVEVIKLFEDFAVTEEEKERYRNFVIELTEHNLRSQEQVMKKGILPAHLRLPAHHRLLGYPDVLYSDSRFECVADRDWEELDGIEEQKRATLHHQWMQEALNWRFLFQIDSDNEADLNWGDVGIMFVFIHREDLENANFDNVKLFYEGH